MAVNQRWSMDFVADQLSNGRRFLDQLAEKRDLPRQIVVDNGTEFTSEAIFFLEQGDKGETELYPTRQANSQRLL